MKKRALFYNKEGTITLVKTARIESLQSRSEITGEQFIIVSKDTPLDNTYIKDGKIHYYEPQPSPYHTLNLKTKRWKLQLKDVKEGKKKEIKSAYKIALSKGYLNYDIDSESLAAMSSAVTYLSLSNEGYLLWTMKDNQELLVTSLHFQDDFKQCFEYVQNLRKYRRLLLEEIQQESDPEKVLQINWDSKKILDFLTLN